MSPFTKNWDENFRAAPGCYADRPDAEQYVVIFQSEVDSILRSAQDWNPKETCGGCFGAWSHAGRPLIYVVSPPGPNAVHEIARACQDADFFRQFGWQLQEDFGLQPLGGWHSHGVVSLHHTSGVDDLHIAKLARRNHIQRMVELLASTSSATERGNQLFQLRAFLYADAQSGDHPRECQLKILPGMSPFRAMLSERGRQTARVGVVKAVGMQKRNETSRDLNEKQVDTPDAGKDTAVVDRQKTQQQRAGAPTLMSLRERYRRRRNRMHRR